MGISRMARRDCRFAALVLMIGLLVFTEGTMYPGLSAQENTGDRTDSGINNDEGSARKSTRNRKKSARKKGGDPDGVESDSKPAKKKSAKLFALNFKDVEIEEFLRVMSQLIGKNIIIDDKIKGKVTIISAKKVPVSQAFNVMKSILEIKGIAVVEIGDIIKVVPVRDAIKKNTEVIVDGKKQEAPLGIDKTVTFLLELQNSFADEVAGTLIPLKSQNTDLVIFRPLNTIIISGNSTEVEGLVKIARALDRGTGKTGQKVSSGGNIHVIHLENASAEELANVLSRVPFSQNAKISQGAPQQEQPQNPQPNPQQPQNPVNPSDRAQRVSKTQGKTSADKTQLSIIANKSTNSLIITATPEEFSEINRIVQELDIVREQVLIEALIVEVNADYGWNFGIDWMLGKSFGAKNKVGFSSLQGDSLPNYQLPDSSFYKNKKLAVPLNTGFQIGYLRDVAQFGFALIHASVSDNNYNVLSTPQIVTVDNQEAELNVGEEISITRDNRLAADGTSFQTFEYKPVGIKLKFTPHITKKNKITIDLYQEVNSVIGEQQILTNGTVIPPTLGKRDIKTKVTVNDGRTIVVGGLMKNNKNVKVNQVPLLGDIPLLGWLFKYKSVTYNKVNLLIFITPHVITKDEKIEAITKKKRNEIKRLKDLYE